MSHEVPDAQFQHMDRRVSALEARVGDLSDELTNQSKELALIAQSQKSNDVLLHEIRDGQRRAADDLKLHVIEEASDRVKMFIGVLASTGAGLSTLGVLIWAVLTGGHTP